MPRLTAVQVAQVCAQAGFKGDALTKAVAVALAESGGNTQAVNVNTDSHRSRDRGLFQINSYWHKEVTDAQAFDPAQNAAAAYRISKGGTDWSQWATWPVVAAGQVPAARLAVAQASRNGAIPTDFVLPGPDVPLPGPDFGPGNPLGTDPFGFDDDGQALNPFGAIKDTGQAAAAIAGAVIKAGAWVADPHNWLRIGLGVGGAFGLLIALSMIGKSGAAGDGAANAVKGAGSAARGAIKAVPGAGTVNQAAKAVKAVA